MLGVDALERGQQLRVDAALQDRRRLGFPSQLRVGDLIAVVPKLAWPVDPNEEVRMAPPAAVEERALVDDVDAAPHCGDRFGMRLL